MTKASKWRVGAIVTTVLVAVTVSALLIRQPPQPLPLSLVFERYSTKRDFYIPDVAFLWLTNASEKTYYLAMTGTRELDTPIGPIGYQTNSSESVMVNCYFSDRTPTGTTNWAQRVSFTNASTGSLGLAPHSAVRLRVPLPLEGQKRKVAVLCAELQTGQGFWTSRIGLRILRILPRSVGKKLLQPKFVVLRVWCDRELSHSDDRFSTK